MALTEEAIADPAVAQLAPVPSRLRTAVVGLGRRGLIHAATLAVSPAAELIGLVDPQGHARRNALGMGLAAPVHSSLESLLRRVQPEAVVVSMPAPARLPVALLALDSGAAVLVDGAPAWSPAEADALSTRAAERFRPMVFGFPLVHHPVFVAVVRALGDRVPGNVRSVRASFSVSRVFNAAAQAERAQVGIEGGILAHGGCDLVFLLATWLGPIVEVRASAQSMHGPLEDELRGSLLRADGVEIGIELSWSSPGYPRPTTVLEVEGDMGRLLASDDALELELDVPIGSWPARESRYGPDRLPQPAPFDVDGEAQHALIATFLADAAGGRPAPTRLERARSAFRIVHGLYASARAGGTPVGVEPTT
jgi:predicted dehydrogenase